MTDTFNKEKRSWIMSRVSSKNTKAEITVRKILWNMGFRYRLHVAKLSGRPDIVFLGRKKVIFVHGCFWHRHEHCKHSTIPQSNTEYWSAKITRNMERDKNNIASLESEGWAVLVIWECELKDRELLEKRLTNFMTIGADAGEKEK